MIRIHNLRSAGFANDPTAMGAYIAAVDGDVVALIGVVTVSYADRKRYPALSFSEEALKRFEAQDVCTDDGILTAMKTALEDR